MGLTKIAFNERRNITAKGNLDRRKSIEKGEEEFFVWYINRIVSCFLNFEFCNSLRNTREAKRKA